jgi:hypothetical protein
VSPHALFGFPTSAKILAGYSTRVPYSGTLKALWVRFQFSAKFRMRARTGRDWPGLARPSDRELREQRQYRGPDMAQAAAETIRTGGRAEHVAGVVGMTV